jgi:hypothetical protein
MRLLHDDNDNKIVVLEAHFALQAQDHLHLRAAIVHQEVVVFLILVQQTQVVHIQQNQIFANRMLQRKTLKRQREEQSINLPLLKILSLILILFADKRIFLSRKRKGKILRISAKHW